MTFTLNINPDLQGLFRHLPPNRKRKIKESLKEISQNHACGKPLQDDLSGLFSYRIGSWRIIYAIETAKKTIHIIAIGPRSAIYQDLARDLAKRKSKQKT